MDSETSSEHSISQYIDDLKAGDQVAAQKIWERFIQRLIQLADKKLKASPRKALDEEDVVQQAFAQFFEQVQQGRFPKLDDRQDLWQVLAMIVDRRAKDQIRKQNSKKAGGGRVNTESVLGLVDDSSDQIGIAKVAELQPSPHLAAEITELLERRLEALGEELRNIAIDKMMGFTNQEIADRYPELTLRTVERRIKDIRDTWSNQLENESN